MTRCIRKKVNLKSNAYNQTGQSYIDQLAAYNSMSLHLRRILFAKSVINTRNKNYLSKKNQRCYVQITGEKKAYISPEETDDVINRLAYDTRHHPMDILRMNLNSKHLDCCNYNLDRQQSRVCSSRICYKGNDQANHRQRSMSKNRKITSSMTTRLPKRKKITPSSINSVCDKEFKSMRQIPCIIGSSTYSQQRKCRYEKNPIFIPYTATVLDSSTFKESGYPIQETNDHRSVSSCSSQGYDDFNCDNKSVEQLASKQPLSQKEEEKKYVKFVYDITKEIMQRGLYTDKELQDVFKKHMDQYKGILNMNKMLYEIYQLKISLNIVDSDTDEELEDLIHAQLRISEIRPPTPPKVLDENKVMEKLESYQKMLKTESGSSNVIKKSVTLVDANPELLVTERDVLMSLMEIGIDPKQAQHVCKTLLHRSRDTIFDETVQAYAEASCPLNLDNLEELRGNDRQISLEAEMAETIRDSTIYNSGKSSVKQEVSSSTSNLISMQDEIIETTEQTES